jgi:hypothetical protein
MPLLRHSRHIHRQEEIPEVVDVVDIPYGLGKAFGASWWESAVSGESVGAEFMNGFSRADGDFAKVVQKPEDSVGGLAGLEGLVQAVLGDGGGFFVGQLRVFLEDSNRVVSYGFGNNVSDYRGGNIDV